MKRARLALLCLLALGHAGPAPAADTDWPEDADVSQVNDGQLVFLKALPAKPVHHHHNAITIDEYSVRTGWVDLRQCHENLDRVPAAQILFRAGRTAGLRVVSAEGIGRAWVEGHSVQLEDIGPGARLCLEARTRALSDGGGGTYVLRNGPFMRRFLDGYYPMHVTMEVRVATDELRFMRITPPGQEGFEVSAGRREVRYDARFAGRLSTEIEFARVERSARAPAASPLP